MVDVLLSISGGAGLFPAAFGACYELHKYVKEYYPHSTIKYGGVSSGCMIALSLALELSEEQVFENYKKFANQFDKFYKTPLTYWYSAVRQSLIDALSGDPLTYQKLNDRLYIGITTISLNGINFETISKYKSNEHVVDTIISSCTLFPLSWTPFRIYEGYLACDGGYIRNYVSLNDHHNVIFKYEHISGSYNLSDWMISSNIDKWNRLYQNGKRHIERNADKWKDMICYQKPVKSNRWKWLYFIFILMMLYKLWKKIRARI